MSTNFDSWCVARTPSTVAVFEYEIFPKIWRMQNTNEKLLFLPYLQCNNLLKFVSEQTIATFYELMEKRVYKAGSLILPQSK